MNTIFYNSIDADTVWYTSLTGSARYNEDIRSALFDFLRNFKKGTAFLLSFQKIIICEFAGIFVAQQRHKNPGFFFFKKGADLSAPFFQPFSCLGRTAFFVS